MQPGLSVVLEGEWRSKMGRRGVYPRMFFEVCGSNVESMGCRVAGNECVQAVEKRELGRGAFRRGEVSSHTSIAGGEVRVNNDLLHGNSNGGWGVRIRSVRKGFA